MIINIISLFLMFLGTRIIWVYIIHQRWKLSLKRPLSHKPHIIVILGSGGHTSEMITLLRGLDYTSIRLTCLVAATDSLSRCRVEEDIAQEWKLSADTVANIIHFVNIPRCREVGQGYISSLVHTFLAIFHVLLPLMHLQPDLILANGPGTCIPPCIAARILEFFGLIRSPLWIIFIESFCRVNSLSLSGKLLYPLCDELIVRWENLSNLYRGTRLMKIFK